MEQTAGLLLMFLSFPVLYVCAGQREGVGFGGGAALLPRGRGVVPDGVGVRKVAKPLA